MSATRSDVASISKHSEVHGRNDRDHENDGAEDAIALRCMLDDRLRLVVAIREALPLWRDSEVAGHVLLDLLENHVAELRRVSSIFPHRVPVDQSRGDHGFVGCKL